jgi:hypothetical protein
MLMLVLRPIVAEINNKNGINKPVGMFYDVN